MHSETILLTTLSLLLLTAVTVDCNTPSLNKYIIMDSKVSFFEAWRLCNYYGLQLASVTSPDDNRLISELVNRPNYGNESFWLAGTDIGREGKWMWITTNKLVVQYSNWGGITPEFNKGNNCMAVGSYSADRTTWDDLSCDEPLMYICQKV